MQTEHLNNLFMIRIWSNRWLQASCLTILVILVYGNTLDVPFYLDDIASILENPYIYDWKALGSIWYDAPLRFVGNFTFSINYALHQYQVSGYHIGNIIIHILAGLAVFALVMGLLKSPVLTENINGRLQVWLPLVVAVIFVAHPLQTQAVTYIVQRLTSLAALFYLASLACYVYARLAQHIPISRIWMALSALLALLAVFTKQNTVTLPVAMLLVEFVFFTNNRKRLLLGIGGILVSFIVLWFAIALIFNYDPFSLDIMLTHGQDWVVITNQQYLATQAGVLWRYLLLFIWPVGLHLDYDVSIASALMEPQVLIALGGHLLLVTGAFLLIRKRPLLSFGVLFWYLAHLIESSLIPISDVLFEHRTYLPNFGLCLLLGWFLVEFLPSKVGSQAAAITFFLVVVMGSASWYRNLIWSDPIWFWTQNTNLAPNKSRPWGQLGKHLLLEHKDKEAVEALKKAVRPVAGGKHQVDQAALVNLILGLQRLGNMQEALKVADMALEQEVLSSKNRSNVLLNKGIIYLKQQKYTKAQQQCLEALKVDPNNIDAIANLAFSYAMMGQLSEAEQLLIKALKKNPAHQAARENLQKIRRAMNAK